MARVLNPVAKPKQTFVPQPKKAKQVPRHVDRAIKSELRRRIVKHANVLDRILNGMEAEELIESRVEHDFPLLLENCMNCTKTELCHEMVKDVKKNFDKMQSFCENDMIFSRLRRL